MPGQASSTKSRRRRTAGWAGRGEQDGKVYERDDFTDLDEVRQRLAAFEERYNATATPFRWKFTQDNLHDLLARIDQHEQRETTTSIPQAA